MGVAGSAAAAVILAPAWATRPPGGVLPGGAGAGDGRGGQAVLECLGDRLGGHVDAAAGGFPGDDHPVAGHAAGVQVADDLVQLGRLRAGQVIWLQPLGDVLDLCGTGGQVTHDALSGCPLRAYWAGAGQAGFPFAIGERMGSILSPRQCAVAARSYRETDTTT
jgi:hypothetical protein